MNPETVFQEALAKTEAQARAAFLEAACAGQPELRAAVDAMLAADAHPTKEHVPELAGPTGDFAPKCGESGYVITGRYMLTEKIGEGGMGEVWFARQTEPVKRNVAVKLIKAGMDSRAVLARFDAERQALALMDHPNIAKVYDGGLTEERHPYFVMELVDGTVLTTFCDQNKLSIRDRLELFVPICQAVQHAHQKGIIHRDLKPSNILVTQIDGKPVPKVIDFGVAKAVGGKLTDETLSTQLGAVVGTLEYMAPEQACHGGHDVDTRADIYSLGVILYELLTGLRPFESKRLRRVAFDELMKIIREEEPSKPSTKLSLDDSLPTLAAARQTEPKKLTALMRGELDWVVMKCLEKSRERRYETANGLARDIQRYLADEPVEARPPSFTYRARKFLRRHTGAAFAAGLVLAALLAGIVGTTWGLLAAREHEQQAKLERANAADNAAAAIQVVHSLSRYVEAFEMGSGNAAASEKQRKEQIDSALASYERLLALQPNDKEVQWNVANMHRMRANLSRFLDQTADAEKSYQESLRLFDQLVAAYPAEARFRATKALTLRDYGQHLQRIGRYQEGANIIDSCIQLYDELLRGEPNQQYYQRLLAYLLLDRSDREVQLGQLAESEKSARRSSALYAQLAEIPGARPEPVDPLFHAMAEHNLAAALREQGRIDDAIAAHDRAVELITGLTKVSNTRDAWSFYHRARTERAWTLASLPSGAEAAISELEPAILGWEKLIKQLGENPTDLHRISVAKLYCGRLRTILGQRDPATKDLTSAATILEGLVGKQTQSLTYKYDLGRTYMALCQLGGEDQATNQWYRKALEMLELIVKRYPENVQFRKALAELESMPKRTQ